MTSQIKYKSWYNCGSRFDFDLQFFKKIILEGVSCNKITFHKIRRCIRNAVPFAVGKCTLKTQVLTKSMNLGISRAGTVNKLFIRGSYTQL